MDKNTKTDQQNVKMFRKLNSRKLITAKCKNLPIRKLNICTPNVVWFYPSLNVNSWVIYSHLCSLFFRPETIKTMTNIGNQLANCIWESNLKGRQKITPTSSRYEILSIFGIIHRCLCSISRKNVLVDGLQHILTCSWSWTTLVIIHSQLQLS